VDSDLPGRLVVSKGIIENCATVDGSEVIWGGEWIRDHGEDNQSQRLAALNSTT
jgi:hypothetical protein